MLLMRRGRRAAAEAGETEVGGGGGGVVWWWWWCGDEIAVLQTGQDWTDCTSPDQERRERGLSGGGQQTSQCAASLSDSIKHREGDLAGWLAG